MFSTILNVYLFLSFGPCGAEISETASSQGAQDRGAVDLLAHVYQWKG